MRVQANRVRVVITGGTQHEVEARVNGLLRSAAGDVNLVAVEYNYQGPEFDGQTQVSSATHGVLLVLERERGPWSAESFTGRSVDAGTT